MMAESLQRKYRSSTSGRSAPQVMGQSVGRQPPPTCIMRPTLGVLAALILSSCASDDARPPSSLCTSEPARQLQRAEKHGPYVPEFPDSNTFTLLGARYTVFSDGRALRYRPEGVVDSFRVPLRDDFVIEGIQHGHFECDPILQVEYTDGLSSGTHVVRFDRRELSLQWTARPFGFTHTSPVFENGFLYVAGFGTVGKLDLESGRYAWRHDNLYERSTGAFNSFASPRISGDTVIFTSWKFRPKPDEVERRVRYHKESGELIPN